jgi:hypothetical protein
MNPKLALPSRSLFKAGLLFGVCAVIALRAAPDEPNPLFMPRSTSSDLQLVVAAPASLNLLRSDNVTGVLTGLVENVFQQSGFRGHLIAVPGHEPAQADIPALEIYLLDWRITGSGNVDCTVSATLTTASGVVNLGVFEGTTPAMFGLRDSFHRAEAFDQAATDAIDNLYGGLREKNLLPASILF